MVRFKEGSIPGIQEEYTALRKQEGNYQAMKNHYYLIQLGHMISQLAEKWEKLWKKAKQSQEQKHRRLLEAWKTEKVEEYRGELERKIQIRLE